MDVNLIYLGMDSWKRPVYVDANGTLWKDVDPRYDRQPDLCTCLNNEFYGEPDVNMCYMKKYESAKITFFPKRITW